MPSLSAGRSLAVFVFAAAVAPGVDDRNRSLTDALADMQAGRLDQAERKLLIVVSDNPSVKAWKTLGMVRTLNGRLEAALEPFANACRLGPKDENACYYLGRNLFALNRNEAAIEAFEKALRAAPRPMRWRVQRAAARNFEVLGRAADAERAFRASIELSRTEATAAEDPRIDYGAFLFRQGRAEEALEPLRDAVAATPSSARANAELGRVLLDLGQLPQASSHLESALASNPSDWPVHLLLGKAYFRLGRTEDGKRETRIGHQGMARQDYGSSTVR